MIKTNVILDNKKWQKYIKNPSIYIKNKFNKLSKVRTFNINKEFSILLTDNKNMKFLNNKFRKKNKSTDILSFPFQTREELGKKLKTEKELYLGDIIINLDKIKNKKIKKDFNMKFDQLWIHGLVHLFGFTHKKDKDFKKMNEIEKKYFELVND